jgi:hypothetical protein
MRILRLVLVALVCIPLSSCGPIIGNLMAAGGGLKSFEVVSGELSSIEAGAELVIVAPFLKGPDGSYLSRGDDAAELMDAFNESGAFKASIYFDGDYNNLNANTAKLRGLDPEGLKAAMGLKAAPRYILIGTIQGRNTTVAPTRGVMMQVSYTLEIIDPKAGESAKVEVDTKDFYRKVAPGIAEELKAGMR